MAKKNRQHRQEQRQTQAAPTEVRQNPTAQAQEPSTDHIGKKVGILINEVVGTAEASKEHLETATFVRRFNVLANNHYPRLSLLAVAVSDGSKAPRKANILHESNVVGTWEPGDHRNGAGAELQEPVVDNVLHEGNRTLSEQNGVDQVKPELDNGLTIPEAGAGAAPSEGQPDSAVVVTTAEVAAEAQTGAAPNDMRLPDATTVAEGAVPAVEDKPLAPNPEQVEPQADSAAGLQQVDADKPAEEQGESTKTAEELAAEEEAKRTSEQQQEEQK